MLFRSQLASALAVQAEPRQHAQAGEQPQCQLIAAGALLDCTMLGLGAGNGAVFQLVPQRFHRELDGEVIAHGGGGCVDALGVELEGVELVWGELGDGAVGGGAELEEALLAIVLEEGGAEDFGELAGGVAAQRIHLKEAILRSDEALGEDEVVKGAGVERGKAVRVAG